MWGLAGNHINLIMIKIICTWLRLFANSWPLRVYIVGELILALSHVSVYIYNVWIYYQPIVH